MTTTGEQVDRSSVIHRETIIGEDQYPVVVSYFEGGLGYQPTGFCHSELEFQFVCNGEGEYFIKDRLYRFTRNSVLLIHRNEIHSRLRGSCQSVKRINLILGPRFMKKHPLIREITKSLGSHHHIELPEKQAVMVKMLLDEIHSECEEKGAYWEDAVSSNVRRFLITLERSKSGSLTPPSMPNSTVCGVIDYLDQMFTRRVPLDELADRFCLSKFWLSRQFSSQTGMSIQDYVIHKRIVLAKTLLETTDMKIAAIAVNVGFNDLSTFNRDFKLRVGVTPSDYRKISL